MRPPARQVQILPAEPEASHPPRWWQKLNPVWWFGNYGEPHPPDWYEPTWSGWHRYLGWYSRNLLHNGQFFVWGIADKVYWRCGPWPDRNWNPTGGLNWARCGVNPKRLWRPFISYMAQRVETYIGWRHNGAFGIALRRRISPFIVLLSLSVFLPTGVWAEEKALPEVEALRLEKAELEVRSLTAEIQARQERIERIKAEALLYIERIRQRDGVQGWELDLANRKWVKPRPVEQTTNDAPQGREGEGGN